MVIFWTSLQLLLRTENDVRIESEGINRQLMAKSPWVITAMFYVTCLRLCIIFFHLSFNRPRQRNYRSLLLLTINTRKMVTHEKIGIGKPQLREILSPGRERGIWASNAGASCVIREVSHVWAGVNSLLNSEIFGFFCIALNGKIPRN